MEQGTDWLANQAYNSSFSRKPPEGRLLQSKIHFRDCEVAPKKLWCSGSDTYYPSLICLWNIICGYHSSDANSLLRSSWVSRTNRRLTQLDKHTRCLQRGKRDGVVRKWEVQTLGGFVDPTLCWVKQQIMIRVQEDGSKLRRNRRLFGSWKVRFD